MGLLVHFDGSVGFGDGALITEKRTYDNKVVELNFGFDFCDAH